MTIAAVVLGLYFVALFYSAVTGEEAHMAGQMEQAHMLDRPR